MDGDSSKLIIYFMLSCLRHNTGAGINIHHVRLRKKIKVFLPTHTHTGGKVFAEIKKKRDIDEEGREEGGKEVEQEKSEKIDIEERKGEKKKKPGERKNKHETDEVGRIMASCIEKQITMFTGCAGSCK